MIVPYRIFEVWGHPEEAPHVAVTINGQVEDGKLIAVNYSYWAWEDDSDYVDAYLYLFSDGQLYLRIDKLHIKHGLGRGEQHVVLYNGFVGTIFQVNTNEISATLKKFGHTKSRSSSTFKKNWVDAAATSTDDKNMRPLKDIIFDYTAEGIKKKNISKFDL